MVANKSSASGVTVLLPDEGAQARYQLPKEIPGYSRNIVNIKTLFCSKVRDPETGKLSGFTIPEAYEFEYRDCLIVDDICDGGGTFLGIAEKLAPLNLETSMYVTHGIFSKGFINLAKSFKRIYTTNSMDISYPPGAVHEFDCWERLLKESGIAMA